MIDTIEIALHNLKLHELIVNMLRIMPKGFTRFDNRGGTIKSDLLFYDTGDRTKEKFIYRSTKAASSHYTIRFMADKEQDRLLFNFSIPKYFYGHNIAQAVRNPNEVDFSMVPDNASIEYNINVGFSRLLRYIKTFFSNEFPGCPVDYRYMELRRLDFCFNQIFLTKKSALDYLEMQRGVRKKNLRDSNLGSNNYETSIFYHNAHYSVKIYHKGTEYAKNDLKEHEKINRRKNKLFYDTGYLQQISDKILRYEITIRPAYMSYLFNTNFFRKKSKQFSLWKTIFNRLKSLNKKNEKRIFHSEAERYNTYRDIYETFRCKRDKVSGLTIFEWLRDYYAGHHVSKDFTPHSFVHVMNRFYQDFDALINYRRKFYFKLSHREAIELHEDNANNDNRFDTVKYCLFDDRMYKLMASKLYDFIGDMKVEYKKPTRHYLEAIDKLNEKADMANKARKGLPSYLFTRERKINKTKMGIVLGALENYSIDQLEKQLGVDRRTINRYKSDLKKIGYTKNTVCFYDVQIPEISFNRYNIEAMTNSYKMFTNQLFRLEHLEKT